MLLAVLPAEPSQALIEALLVAGLPWRGASDGDWADVDALVVEAAEDTHRDLRIAHAAHEDSGLPILIVADRARADLIEQATFADDFLFGPPDPVELRLRLNRLTGEDAVEVLTFKDLELNTATYQATLDTRPLDLTYMEYELLRFFVQHPRRVWTREQLLSRVWGYDYFGGARTVDVHVRRLRAKLGEERARWISTVRSVGYRFG